ncbi:MAG: hypothetical protein WCP69_04545 [Bacteroidota bacterium]
MEPIIQYAYYTDITLTLLDLFFAIAVLIVAGIWGYMVQNKNPELHYRFYTRALIIKIVSAMIFCLLYLTYYEGDTLDYFHGMNALNRVGGQNIDHYFDLLFQGNKPEFFSYFNAETMYPDRHMWRDPKSFFVIRFLSPFALLGFGSYMITTLIISFVSFFFLWKMYITFARLYPQIDFKIAIAILFMPSVLFWGSGILKDTIIMSSVAVFTTVFLKMAVAGKYRITSILSLVLASWLMITIKAYVFVAMIPGAAIWFAHGRILRIKSRFFRYATFPVAISVFLFLGILMISQMGASLGEYGSMDKMVKKAQLTQDDLKRGEQYGNNYYDLGKIENTPGAMIRVMPQAVIAGLYRPFIWESRNPFVALSGLENLFTLLLTISILIRTKIYKVFSFIGKDPVLIFAIIYTIMFAFGIGLASANFGALVRYRIPGMPFLMLSLFILDYYLGRDKQIKMSEHQINIEKASLIDIIEKPKVRGF